MRARAGVGCRVGDDADADGGMCCGESCNLYFIFQFSFWTFLLCVFCANRTPNRVLAKVRGNSCRFSILRVGVFASGNGIDGM